MSEEEPNASGRVAKTLGALGLTPLDARSSPLGLLAAQLLRRACPEALTERESRILSAAEELARAGSGPRVAEQAYLYLALACCSWAKDASQALVRRELSLLAATAFAALAGENARAALGVQDRLDLLAFDSSLRSSVRACVALVADPQTLVGSIEHELASLLGRTGRGASAPRPRRQWAG